MRRLMFIFAILLMASIGMAQPLRSKILTLTSPAATNLGVTVTNILIRGQIESIDIDVVNAATTADVSIVISPLWSSTMDSFILLSTNKVDEDITFRPRLNNHDQSGVPLTSDPSDMHSVYGEAVLLSMTNFSATGAVFKVRIKFHAGF